MTLHSPRDIAIFATGTPYGGWSGAEKLLEHSAIVDRVAVIMTNYPDGWVAELAEKHPNIALEVWEVFPKRQPDETFSARDQQILTSEYQRIMKEYGLEYIFLSWWVKHVMGLPANKVVNIHPGPLGEYGGIGSYGKHDHEKVWQDYFDGKIVSSAVTMHFVQSGEGDEMDNGEGIIVQVPVPLTDCQSQADVKSRVNDMEHQIQWQITEHVINGRINWSGEKGEPVVFEEGLTIQVDGKDFPLDGKLVDLSKGMNSYNNTVVKAGDNASGNFKGACDRANKETSHCSNGLIRQTSTGSWETIIPPSETPIRVKEDIDGVGTKVHIYLDMFEALCVEYRDAAITEAECIGKSKDIWTRMLHDLIAMNVDDLRDGQMAVAVTNIIDINHLKGERGRIFSLSMALAMEETIHELDIAIVAGETAILGQTATTLRLIDLIEQDILSGIDENTASIHSAVDNLEKIIGDKHAKVSQLVVDSIHSLVVKLLADQISKNDRWKKDIIKRLQQILVYIDFNIGGTVQGLMKHDKLVPLEGWHVLVAFYETPDEHGIIGPRSNGITSIRKHMAELAGRPDWASMKFEDFLSHIWNGQTSKLSETLKRECTGLTLGQIATGKTTVFNPFISRDLLGGLDGIPNVQLSSIIHVTGNPWRKIHEGLRGAENLAIDMDISNTKLPQIIEIIQTLTGMSDSDAMSSWNMGIPYVVACPESEVVAIIERAQARGMRAEKIGAVQEREEGAPVAMVKGVGVMKSEIVVE